MSPKMEPRKKLPFPTRTVEAGGRTVEEYVIPYVFKGVPALDEERYDLHEGRLFKVKEFRVVWEDGFNYLMSPYYVSSGGSVIDWMPADWADPGDEDAEA